MCGNEQSLPLCGSRKLLPLCGNEQSLPLCGSRKRLPLCGNEQSLPLCGSETVCLCVAMNKVCLCVAAENFCLCVAMNKVCLCVAAENVCLCVAINKVCLCVAPESVCLCVAANKGFERKIYCGIKARAEDALGAFNLMSWRRKMIWDGFIQSWAWKKIHSRCEIDNVWIAKDWQSYPLKSTRCACFEWQRRKKRLICSGMVKLMFELKL